MCLIDPFSNENKPKIIRSFTGGSSDIVGVVPCVGRSLLVARSGGVERLRASTLLPYYTSDDYYYNSSSSSSSSSSCSDTETETTTDETESENENKNKKKNLSSSHSSSFLKARSRQEEKQRMRRERREEKMKRFHSSPPSASPATTAGTPSVIGGHLLCISSDPFLGRTVACGCADGSILSWSIVIDDGDNDNDEKTHKNKSTANKKNNKKKNGRNKFSIETGDRKLDADDDGNNQEQQQREFPASVNRPNDSTPKSNNNGVSETISYLVHRDWVTSCEFLKTELGMLILVSISDDGTVCTSDPFTGIVFSTAHGPDLYPPYQQQQQSTTTTTSTNRTKRNRAVALSVLGQQVAVAWEDLRGRILRVGIDGKFIFTGNQQEQKQTDKLISDDSFFQTPAVATSISLTKDYIIAGCEDEALSIIDRSTGAVISKCSAHHKSRICCGSFLSTISGLMVVSAPSAVSNQLPSEDKESPQRPRVKEDSCFITWSISDDGELVQWIVPPPSSSMNTTLQCDFERSTSSTSPSSFSVVGQKQDNSKLLFSTSPASLQSQTQQTQSQQQNQNQNGVFGSGAGAEGQGGYTNYLMKKILPTSLNNFLSNHLGNNSNSSTSSSTTSIVDERQNLVVSTSPSSSSTFSYSAFPSTNNNNNAHLVDSPSSSTLMTKMLSMTLDDQMKVRQNGVSKTIVLPMGELVSICPVKF